MTVATPIDWEPVLASSRPYGATTTGDLDLAGKSVAIVGNAGSLLANRLGAHIDAHDIVLRMNNGLPEQPVSQGRRTDILVFSIFSLVARNCAKFGAKNHIWMSPKGRDENPWVPAGTMFYHLDRWQQLHDVLGSRPSVGAMTLDVISTSNARAVSIFGFDFKRSMSFYQTHQHIGPHDYVMEEKYASRLLERPEWRIFLDA